MEKVSFPEKLAAKAVEKFKAGFNCCEATLGALCEGFGMEKGIVPKIASGFGAGTGYLGYTCGAVNAAVMAFGLKFGRKDPKDKERLKKTLETTYEFCQKFKEKFGSCMCRDLIKVDLAMPEGREIHLKEIRMSLCVNYVKEATKMAAELLLRG